MNCNTWPPFSYPKLAKIPKKYKTFFILHCRTDDVKQVLEIPKAPIYSIFSMLNPNFMPMLYEFQYLVSLWLPQVGKNTKKEEEKNIILHLTAEDI